VLDSEESNNIKDILPPSKVDNLKISQESQEEFVSAKK